MLHYKIQIMTSDSSQEMSEPGSQALAGGFNTVCQEKIIQQDHFNCSDCQGCFYDLWMFLQHKSKHNIWQGLFVCYVCKSAFRTHGALHLHYTSYHHIGISAKDTSTASICQDGNDGLAADKSFEAEGCNKRKEGEHHQPMTCNKEDSMPQSSKALTPAVTPNKAKPQRRVIILCTPEVKSKLADRKKNNPKGHMNASPKKHAAMRVNSVKSSGVQTIADARPINVASYDKDFLFQIGMKESSGNLKYMREVFICLHCPAFERSSLDCLIAHMRECHRSEVVDLCLPRVTHRIPVKSLPGIKQATVTSFKEYKSRLSLQKSHKKNRLLGQQHRCAYCNKCFTEPLMLLRHLKMHSTATKRCLCEECGRIFRNQNLLRNHKKGHLNASYGKMKCLLCNFQSDDLKEVNQHYMIHPKESHLCHICGNMYSQLRKHVKVHSLDRMYPCPFNGCTFRFNTEVSCKIHYRAHTEEGRRFTCYECDRKFSRKHFLQRHWTKLHGNMVASQDTLGAAQSQIRPLIGSAFNVGPSTSKTMNIHLW